MTDDCGFCQGEPVGDAASWLDGKPRPPAPCPRCGDITFPNGHVFTYREQSQVWMADRARDAERTALHEEQR